MMALGVHDKHKACKRLPSDSEFDSQLDLLGLVHIDGSSDTTVKTCVLFC